MRRRATGTSELRAQYTEHVRGLAAILGPIPGNAFAEELARLEAGRPVVVRGWAIGVRPYEGDYCLEADGSVTPVQPVYVDPDAPIPTVRHYRRPDGAMVAR